MSLQTMFRRWLERRSPRSCRRLRHSIPADVQYLETRTLPSGVPAEFVDPHPQAGNQFGATVTVLTNGNVVITSPNDDAGGGNTAGGYGAGAVYLFNGQTGTWISTLTGSNPGDQIGSNGVTPLSNGNYVIDSARWMFYDGAVTWGNGTTGVTGVVSASNSLVGSNTLDQVGSGISSFSTQSGGVTALNNGNYVIDSPLWNGNEGAVTWGSGMTGVIGVVGVSNSLIGSLAGDQVGNLNFGINGVTVLSNGNYVVDSPSWNGNRGAVTWGSGTTGVTGVVGTANSLVGSIAGDQVGSLGSTASGVTGLSNGNYVIASPFWKGNRGAVTWGSGTAGVKGTVSLANSLIGSLAGDKLGNGFYNGKYNSGITALNNGNYVVDSPSWNGNVGAVTWGNGTTGVKGYVSQNNSLVGSLASDQVGSGYYAYGGVTALSNGNYVIDSPFWNYSRGAVTWGSGVSGLKGVVSEANSLVGSFFGDQVGGGAYGFSHVTALNNGNYVVDSSFWNGLMGAVTLASGTKGLIGLISSVNSLVGSTANDQLGSSGVFGLSNGNYVVSSPNWTNVPMGNASSAGAVTWGNGTTGVHGSPNAANSIIGSKANDNVGTGTVTALTNGNFVVNDSKWHNNAGAVTWGNGATGTNEIVSSDNSLVGTTANASVGSGGVTPLTNGNFVVYSSIRENSTFAQIGAVTWGSGTNGATGTINATNSLLEMTADSLPSNSNPSKIIALSNGNYVVDLWNNGPGAVAFGNGTTGISGELSRANSLMGQTSTNSGSIGVTVITDDAQGAIYAAVPGTGSGHVYRGSAATGFSTGGPSIEVSTSLGEVANGTGLVSMGTTNLGTPITQTIAVSNYGSAPLIVQPITVPSGFSVLNNFTVNESIAAGTSVRFTLQLNAAANGSPSGAVTIVDNAPVANPFRFHVSATVTPPVLQNWFNFADPHPTAGNQFGATQIVLPNGNVLITASNDDAGGGHTAAGTGAGAVYLFNGQTGSLISALTGSNSGDQIGASGVITLSNGNFVVNSPYWNGTRGAVTWGSGTTGVKGAISAANSLVGTTANDYVGDFGLKELNNGNYIVESPFWNGNRGAATWGNGMTGITGNVSATNSLVGTAANDFIGSGVAVLSNGNYVVNTQFWNGRRGEVTWGSGTTGVAGEVSAANSLLGSTVNDNVGSAVTVLSNGNYVVDSEFWNSNRGAATWSNGTTGLTGVVSAANSLVGTSANDFVGDKTTLLNNGNYVVASGFWNGTRGAATWGDGSAGTTGIVSAANSLLGTAANEYIGGTVTVLSNGNYVVDSPNWNGTRGAATWGNGTKGVAGIISAANSLIGATPTESVGSTVTALSNGNYVVGDPAWNGRRGAMTWSSGTTGVTGVISAANSLVGSLAGDQVGSGSYGGGGVTILSNGNYLVSSPNWNGYRGAVTWVSATKGVTGLVTATNSLVGTTANDNVGNTVTAMSNGNYIVDSPNWNTSRGAVTWGSGTSGVAGVVSATNSLVGAVNYDTVGGYSGVTLLSNGNYVVDSPNWSNGTNYDAGAVTWANGTTGARGTISAANSMIGASPFDEVGLSGVTALTNGNYVFESPNWNSYRGAATWGSGTTGATGVVSATNSLVGTTLNDQVGYGGITALANGNYVVDSYGWNNGTKLTAGAVTWANGFTGAKGTLNAINSLVGSSDGDSVGEGGVTALANGNYVVDSYGWNNGAASSAGAVTFGDGTRGVKGIITAANSLIGTIANDQVGSQSGSSSVTTLPNGSYIVVSGNWHNVGAFTFGNGTTGVSGALSRLNSVLGQTPITPFFPFNVRITPNPNGTLYVSAPGNGSDYIYRGSAATGFTLITNSGPSISVADYSGGLTNGVGILSLGTATLGTAVTQTVTVTNNGNRALVVQPVMAPTGFSIVPGTNFTANESIAPGGSASFTLQLDANATGAQQDIVTITSNDPTANSFMFHVKGIVAAPNMVVQQGTKALVNGTGTVNAGSTVVGTAVSQVFTVSNNGNAPLLLTSATVPTGFSIVSGINFTTGQLIAPGTSANFTVQMDATSTGTPSGVITIASNDPTRSAFTFNMSGTVKAPTIVVQQGSTNLVNGEETIDFGSTVVGTVVTQVITVTNSGNAALIVQPVTAPSGFSVLTNFTANQSIAAGDSASFTLQLNAIAVGTANGVVTIPCNDTKASPFTVNVTGKVTQTLLAAAIQVSWGEILLANNTGTVIFNDNSAGNAVSQLITVANQGNAALIVQPVTVPSGFSVLNNFSINQVIAAGETASLQIQLNANVSGTPTGTVTINNNDSTANAFTFRLVANNAPTAISLNPSVAASNLTSLEIVGALTTTDPDSAIVPQTFQYSVSSPTFQNSTGATILVFYIDDHGNLEMAPAAPAGVYFNVAITSTDQGGMLLTQQFTIYVTGTSTVGIGASTQIATGTPSGFTIATLPTTVVQVQNALGKRRTATDFTNRAMTSVSDSSPKNSQTENFNVITYQLGVGGDNSDFTINTLGQLQSKVALDASVKRQFHLTIISTNTITGLSTTNLYTVTIVPVLNPGIVVKPATFEIATGSTNGATVGTVSATDPDGQKPTFAIIAGNTGGAFAINSSTGEITIANAAALQLSNHPAFSLTVQASDAAGTGSGIITINLAQIMLSNSSVTTNARIGTRIGQFSTTDTGTGGKYRYSIVPGKNDAADFTIDATGHLRLSAHLDAAVRTTYTIEVLSTNQYHESIRQSFVITVLGPSNVTLSNDTILKNASPGTIIGQFRTTENGLANNFTYRLPPSAFDNRHFTVDDSGQLVLKSSLHARIGKKFSIYLISTDQLGLTIRQKFSITVN